MMLGSERYKSSLSGLSLALFALFCLMVQISVGQQTEFEVTADGTPWARTTLTGMSDRFGCCKDQGVYARPVTWQWVISPESSHPVDYLTISVPWLSFTNNRDRFRVLDGITLEDVTELLEIEGNNNRYKLKTMNTSLPEAVIEFRSCHNCGPSRMYGDGGFIVEYDSTLCPFCYAGDLVDCECQCDQGWYGWECDKCDSDRFCFGHGKCGPGYVCQCDEGYLGDNCEITCDSHLDCNDNGECTEEGACDCDPLLGFYGSNCLCNALSSCNATTVTHGSCVEVDQNIAVLTCDEGYGGCNCECNNVDDCSGNGVCSDTGCHCDVQHEGEHCEDINLDGYCRLSLNGFECVPGLQYLGIGFDITTGQYTERLRALDFRLETSIIDLGPPYLKREIPVDVQIEFKPPSYSKDAFLATTPMEYVRSLSMGHKFQASSLGAPLVEAQFEEGMFIKDPRAVNNIPDAYWDNHFIARQQRVYSEWHLSYKTNLPPTLRPVYAAAVNSLPAFYTAAVQQQFFDFFRRFGTHVSYGIDVGGAIVEDVAVSQCIFRLIGRTAIRNELVYRLDQKIFGAGVSRDPSFPSLMADPSVLNQYITASFAEVFGGNSSLLLSSAEQGRPEIKANPDFYRWRDQVLNTEDDKFTAVLPRLVPIWDTIVNNEGLVNRLKTAYDDYIQAAFAVYENDPRLETPTGGAAC